MECLIVIEFIRANCHIKIALVSKAFRGDTAGKKGYFCN